MAYWYNVSTGRVETGKKRSRDADVLGPYPTREAAEHALETARKRTEANDAADAAWNDDEPKRP